MKKGLSILLLFAALFLTGADPRMVSLSPNLTEIIFRLGCGGNLVGRSDACDYPPEARKIPVVGNFGKPFLEPLLAVKPDIVVTEPVRNGGALSQLKNFNIQTVTAGSATLEQYEQALLTLGKLLNCADRAATEQKKHRGEIAELRVQAAAIPLDQRPKVLVIVQAVPVIAVGRDSFINEMIELAGGRNVASSEPRGYFNCSLEWITKQAPDVLIVAGMPEAQIQQLLAASGWSELPAVKNRRIYSKLDPSLLYRLGPRTLDGVRALRRCLYPESN